MPLQPVLLSVLLLAVIALAVVAGMLTGAHLLGPRRSTPVKQMPYESGMDPIGDARGRFDIRYYLVAIVFLIFDVEAVFLFPWALVFLETATFVFYAMIIFIAILLFGVAYAWRKGVLQWR